MLGALPCISMASTESKKTLHQRIDKMIDEIYPDAEAIKKENYQDNIKELKREHIAILEGIKDSIYRKKDSLNLKKIAKKLVHHKINEATRSMKMEKIIRTYKGFKEGKYK